MDKEQNELEKRLRNLVLNIVVAAAMEIATRAKSAREANERATYQPTPPGPAAHHRSGRYSVPAIPRGAKR